MCNQNRKKTPRSVNWPGRSFTIFVRAGCISCSCAGSRPTRQCRDGPGEDVQQEQGGDGAEVGEHRIHPDDPEHAGAHDDDDGGDDAAPNSTGGGNAGVHQGADTEGETHDLQPLHTGGDHVRLIGEKSKELVSEQQQQSAADAAHQKGIQQNRYGSS